MPYLGVRSKLQNNWIYIAIAVIFGCFASFKQPELLGLVILLSIFLWFRISKMIACLSIVVSLSFYSYVEQVIPEKSSFVGQTTATVTSTYKIKGDRWSGFVRLPDHKRVYVVYKIEDEQQADTMKSINWTGKLIDLHLQPSTSKLQSHEFEFSFDTYLLSKGTLSSFEASQFTFVGENELFTWKIQSLLSKYRSYFYHQVISKVPNSLQDEFVSLTIGDRSLTTEEDMRLYQKLGLSHLFAISGLHIALLTGAIYQLLIYANVRLRSIQLFLLFTLPIYMMVAGAAPSVIRATMMVWIITLFLRFQRKINPADLLSIVLIVTLLYHPFYLLQPGYQLSFTAVFSLIYSSALLKNKSGIVMLLMTTCICQLAVMPIVLFHFQQISIISLAVNVFAIPLFTFIILPISIFYSILAQFPLELLPFIQVYAGIRSNLQVLFQSLASIPYMMWTPPSIREILLLTFIAVGTILYLWERKFTFAVVALLVSSGLWHHAPKLDDHALLSFIYVGQGDSTLIEFPHKKMVILVDTGGIARFAKEDWQQSSDYQIGRSIVTPYLRSKGISTIDLLILTHADSDHTEGAEEILEDFHVKQVVVPQGILLLPEMQDVLITAHEKNIPIVELTSRATLEHEETKLILAPVPGPYQGNDSSILTIFESYGRKVILPGDLEEQGEKDVSRLYEQDLKGSDLLKLGHHGSKTSTSEDWLELLKPRYAIGSAGQDNRYGHPHDEVMDRLVARTISYWGTHDFGTIEVSISARGELNLDTFKKDTSEEMPFVHAYDATY